jgi:hypothetical protein
VCEDREKKVRGKMREGRGMGDMYIKTFKVFKTLKVFSM